MWIVASCGLQAESLAQSQQIVPSRKTDVGSASRQLVVLDRLAKVSISSVSDLCFPSSVHLLHIMPFT